MSQEEGSENTDSRQTSEERPKSEDRVNDSANSPIGRAVIAIIVLVVASIIVAWVLMPSDFSVSVYPMSGKIQAGSTGQMKVTVDASWNYFDEVLLRTCGELPNIAINFAPESETPSYTSDVTITVGSRHNRKSQ